MNRKLGRSSLLVAATLFFLLALPHPTWAQTPLFNPQTEYVAATKNGPSGIAVGDFNGDGKPDLAVVNFGDWNVYLLLGNGDGTFQPAKSVFFSPGFPWYIAEDDFNGDGKLDLAVTNYGDNSVSVLLGNGDGTFQAARTFPVGVHPGLVAVGDFNGDGKPDLAVADYGCPLDCNSSPSNTVTVLLGNGNGTFRPAPSLTVGNGPAGVAVGDFNGDGKPDLAVANLNDNTLSVLLGNGDGTFQAPQTFAGVGTKPYFVAVGDFNRDGKPDLVITNHLGNTVTVLLGNGDGTFQPAQTFLVNSDPVYATVADFNGDGVQDLAVANLHALTISVLLGNAGTGSTVVATPTFSPAGGTYTGSVTVSISDATIGATIHYTTDGSTPTTSSPVYGGALTFTQTTTLKAMAAASGMTDSAVASATYTIQQQQVATPTFSPGGGTYTGSVTVSISDATSGATIHYTTDGSTPTTSSPIYGGALTFTQTTTLKAMAAASGMTNSAVASATYTIQQQSFTLSVNKTDLGSGTVTSSPAGINCGSNCSASYVSGTSVTLTATPDLFSGFGGWSGCDSVSGNTCTVDMNSARSVTADFRLLGLL